MSVPLLTSSDLLASAAQSCQLSIKAVASCPRSLETNKDEMVCEDQISMNNTSKSSASSAQSSSNSNYSTVVISAQLIHQTEALVHSLDKRMNGGEVNGVYQSMRTSPGHHKRPACVLDEEEGRVRRELKKLREKYSLLGRTPRGQRSM